MIRPADVDLLRCPACRGALIHEGTVKSGLLARGTLGCAGCGATWPVRGGWPRLYRE